MLAAMADLEQHAVQRDKRFLVRLIALLVVGGLAGLWAVSHLTSSSFGGCAARTFGTTTSGESE